MQTTSALYKELLAQGDAWYEVSLVVGESGRLVDNTGALILFGRNSILVSRGGGDSGYMDNVLISVETSGSLFSGNSPAIGCCVSREINASMFEPVVEIPRRAMLVPYVRLTDGEQYSEWIQQGVYFIDSREMTRNDDGRNILTLHGFDSMLLTEQDYPATSHAWPALDSVVVRDIADAIGVRVDDRTLDALNGDYIQFPGGYSMRETLSFIGVMNSGNWIMSEQGELLLVPINSMPRETNYLIDSVGDAILFGGDRILV